MMSDLEQQQKQYLYQIWPGRNRFYFKGRIMTGPIDDMSANCCVWFMLIIIPIPFFTLTWEVSWNVSPILPISTLFLIIITILFLILTTVTDPGIIPRRTIQEKININVHLEQEDEQQKFCQECQIYRPPRSSHCRICDNCIQVYDHHCPFVNNCVGKRNYRYFFSFLISVFASGLSALITMLIWMSQVSEQPNESNKTLAYLFLVPIMIVSLVVLLFFLFHVFLRVTGKTTREKFKNLSNTGQQDFDWFNLDEGYFNQRQLV